MITQIEGEQIAKIVNFGISQSNLEWDFLSKIDSMWNYLTILSLYFQNLQNPQIGIASGSCYVLRGRRSRDGFSDQEIALKTYRKKCYEDIGGIGVNGWDELTT